MKTIKLFFLSFVFILSSTIEAQNYDAFKVSVTGSGDPILFFPGFSCTEEVFDNVVQELSESYECHVFTFAGFGNVPAIEMPWLSTIKSSIEQYITDHQLKFVTFIGHSLGGTLGLWLGTNSILDISNIIAIDALPSVGALMIPNFDSANIVYDSPYTNQMLGMDKDNFANMANQLASGMVLNKEKVNTIKDWIIKTDRKTYVYGYIDLMKLDLREELSKIQAPISVLMATEPYGLDQVKTTFENQYQNAKNFKLLVANNSAHFIMYDRPEWLLETLKSELVNK